MFYHFSRAPDVYYRIFCLSFNHARCNDRLAIYHFGVGDYVGSLSSDSYRLLGSYGGHLDAWRSFSRATSASYCLTCSTIRTYFRRVTHAFDGSSRILRNKVASLGLRPYAFCKFNVVAGDRFLLNMPIEVALRVVDVGPSNKIWASSDLSVFLVHIPCGFRDLTRRPIRIIDFLGTVSFLMDNNGNVDCGLLALLFYCINEFFDHVQNSLDLFGYDLYFNRFLR